MAARPGGFILADEKVGPREIGDEPFQIYTKFKQQVRVAVGEERILAIPMMLAETEGLQAILLDDAFQHRYLKADGYILLTTFEKPFYKDHLLPVGRLREGRGNARRADVVVVTKCPDTITRDEKESMISNIKKFVPDEIPVFFAGLKYGTPYPLQQGGKVLSKNLILVTGIVDHKPMLK